MAYVLYPAVVYLENGFYTAEFPDFPNISISVQEDTNASDQIETFLKDHISHIWRKTCKIPEPKDFSTLDSKSLETPSESFVMMIRVSVPKTVMIKGMLSNASWEWLKKKAGLDRIKL